MVCCTNNNVCNICNINQNSANEILYKFCKCDKGYYHIDCLYEWKNENLLNSDCSICGTEYDIQHIIWPPIYIRYVLLLFIIILFNYLLYVSEINIIVLLIIDCVVFYLAITRIDQYIMYREWPCGDMQDVSI